MNEDLQLISGVWFKRIGYGNGTLEYEISNKQGIWKFTPEYALNQNDGLPENAWISFLKPVCDSIVNSTRTDFRPFTVEEQKSILTIGACLQCHDDNSEVMQRSIIKGLTSLIRNQSENCILPYWE